MFRVLFGLLLAASVALPAFSQGKGYSTFVGKAKATLTKDFKDPEGAKYRNLGVYQDKMGDGVFLCGEVNAKNAYGAYTGYTAFYSDAKSVQLNDGSPTSTYEIFAEINCSKKLAAAQ